MMTCKDRAFIRRIHASAWVPGALALAALLIGGCSKEEPQVEDNSAAEELPAPADYMKDEAFRTTLKEQRQARNQLVAKRAQLLKRVESLSLAVQAKMPNASKEEIEAELQKDPEYVSLAKRLDALVAAYEESRAETLKTVRERIAVPQPVSK